MAKSRNPAQFAQEVRQEVSKVTWPTRRETMLTTVMVFIMVTVVSLFFFGVDQLLNLGIAALLGVSI